MLCAQPGASILIVGAGPTGLALAHDLLRRGVKPRIIDKAPSISRNPKALGITPRTLELLAPAGITSAMMAQGLKAPIFRIWSSRWPIAQLDFARGIESSYPFILMLPQYITETILTDHIVRLGGEVERGVELVSLTLGAESVEAVLRHADGTEERTCCEFLIGCDGAHSTVRHMIGAPFVGKTVAQQFVTGDVRMRWNIPHDQAVAYMNRGRFIAFFPLPDGRHLFLSAAPPAETRQEPVTLEEIQHTIDLCGPVDAQATDPGALGRYRVHQRKVDRYVHQRALLAGDAAHIQSPLGAQGMNAGIQDAMNLAWKLALIVRGHAPPRLLESYQIERAEVGARLLRDDALLTQQAFLRHPLASALRDYIASHVFPFRQIQHFITGTATGMRISYHHGPLAFDYRGEGVSPPPNAVHVGERAPNGAILTSARAAPSQLYDLLTGLHHTLLIFSSRGDAGRRRELQSALADWRALLEIHFIQTNTLDNESEHGWLDKNGALARRYGITREGMILIRPDGYISFRSQPIAAEPLLRFLRAHFSVPHAV